MLYKDNAVGNPIQEVKAVFGYNNRFSLRLNQQK